MEYHTHAPNEDAVPLAGAVHRRAAGGDVSTGSAVLARDEREQPNDHRLVGHCVEVVCDGAGATAEASGWAIAIALTAV